MRLAVSVPGREVNWEAMHEYVDANASHAQHVRQSCTRPSWHAVAQPARSPMIPGLCLKVSPARRMALLVAGCPARLCQCYQASAYLSWK